ncbi:HIT family protein [Sphingomonas naphthae]|uniref:HIT family protein n=1 Tax=Sphingomonas naphthae TaxID=1813468 RepID=A0ABY7TLU3_9SPHN|nr:HIT family protein [Sphingomonas naphthae]WCT73662.1 HIT family protein [Sphingomonas naphthae]
MSLEGTYDPDNIFAKILRGDLPAYTIYQTDDVLAFLDLFPQSTGHSLVIPRRSAARNFLDIAPDELAVLYRETQIVARAIVAELAPDGVQIMQFNGAPAGQTVFHLHVHIIPRWSGTELGMHAKGKADPDELAALQARLAKRLKGE